MEAVNQTEVKSDKTTDPRELFQQAKKLLESFQMNLMLVTLTPLFIKDLKDSDPESYYSLKSRLRAILDEWDDSKKKLSESFAKLA